MWLSSSGSSAGRQRGVLFLEEIGSVHGNPAWSRSYRKEIRSCWSRKEYKMCWHDPVTRSTAIQEAVGGGHGHLVNDLLLAGACTGTHDDDGFTPLHATATSGRNGILSA